ncbi:hypothetical protein ACQJBY_037685 [Aegilops geniculata]
MRTTQSPSRSLELFSEEDDRAAAVAVDETDEDGLVPSGCCTSVPRITIKGTTGVTMELGELPRSKNAPENKVVHGGVQRACMSEPEAWTSIRTEALVLQRRPAPSVS